MENTIAIKLPVGSVSAKAYMNIKKLTGLSLGVIKERVANDDFVYVCDYFIDLYDCLRIIVEKAERKKACTIERF